MRITGPNLKALNAAEMQRPDRDGQLGELVRAEQLFDERNENRIEKIRVISFGKDSLNVEYRTGMDFALGLDNAIRNVSPRNESVSQRGRPAGGRVFDNRVSQALAATLEILEQPKFSNLSIIEAANEDSKNGIEAAKADSKGRNVQPDPDLFRPGLSIAISPGSDTSEITVEIDRYGVTVIKEIGVQVIGAEENTSIVMKDATLRVKVRITATNAGDVGDLNPDGFKNLKSEIDVEFSSLHRDVYKGLFGKAVPAGDFFKAIVDRIKLSLSGLLAKISIGGKRPEVDLQGNITRVIGLDDDHEGTVQSSREQALSEGWVELNLHGDEGRL